MTWLFVYQNAVASLLLWAVPTVCAAVWAFLKARRLYRQLVDLWERHVEVQEDQARHLERVAYQLEQPKEMP